MSNSNLPEPPRLPAQAPLRKGRARRERGLNQDAIVDAAMHIVDTQGLDALTMRAVAARLQTGAASLYAYVGSKEDLVDLLNDRVIAEMFHGDEGRSPDPDHWREEFKATAHAMRGAWNRHGDLARASFARIPTGENTLSGAEWMSSILRAGGLSDRVVGLAMDLIALYIGAIAYEDSLQSRSEASQEDWAAFAEELGTYYRALPADRFPNLVALASALISDEDRFEFGLDVILAGLEALDHRRSASAVD